MFRAFAWAFACVGLVSAWTRLAVVESGSCEKAGCEVMATCPEKTWPVACRAISSRAEASNSWLKDGRCVASSIFDERITAKAACTSMFRSFVVTGDRDARDARCPEGSSLEKCFCQECMGQLAINSNGTCLAPEGRPQALCLSGDTQWLLQNAASIGFVEYCGWMPYQRPRNLPAESYRNDSDCRHVMAMDPVGFAGCSTEECTSLEDCIARCDVCANCSAVLQMASGTSPARCYMQENIHVDEIRSQGFETGFFVNERNGFGCNGRIEDRMARGARGITGVKLFADLECQKELKPEKLYMMDAVGLMPLDGTWVPKCSQSRCSPGGLSFVATFVKPSVVRCVAVQASDSYGLGWRLSKTSAALTGIQSLTETVWQEVARSGKGMGVRATWDGLMEIEADLRSSASENQVPGGDVAVLPVVISLLVFFIFLSLIIWMRYFNTHRNAAENLRPAATMVPAMEVALTLDEITFRDEVRAESTVSYMLPSEIPILQILLDFTYRSTVTHERRCPQHCARAAPCPCVQVGGTPGLPVAFHALNALRFRATSMTGYVKKRKEIEQRRDALKCLEMSSQLAVAKYPQLKEVLANLEPSSNEAYLWYGTNIRRAFDFLDLAAGSDETAKLGLRFAESCTKADEHAMDDHGHYENVFALLLCRVCLGRFYYTTDMNSQTREEVSGFDSVLLDRAGDGCRECVVYNPKQVMPEFLILYRRYYEGQDLSDLSDLSGSVPTDLDTFKLEVPIYWQSLSRPLSEPFRSQPHVATSLQRILQSLVEASSSSRHLISSARQIEDSQLWLRYLGYRRARRSKRPVAIKGAIEAPSLDPWPNELLLWYPCGNPEEATSASEGSFQSSPRQRRAGIHLTETLTSLVGSAVLLCRVTLGDVHYTDSAPDLAAVQSARSVGKDALVAHASRGRKDFVLFQEEQLYPEFLLELNTE